MENLISSSLQMFFLLHCMLMVFSTMLLQPGVNYIQSGSDISLKWNLSSPVNGTILNMTKGNRHTIAFIMQNVNTRQILLKPDTTKDISMDNIEVVSNTDGSFNLLLRKVGVNDSQTIRIGDSSYTMNIYEPPVLRHITHGKHVINFVIQSSLQENITWSFNNRPLGNVGLDRKGSSSYYTVSYPSDYLCSSFIAFNATVFDSKLVEKVFLPNDFNISNINVTINGSCYTVEWFLTATNCLYTSIELYTTLEGDPLFKLGVGETSVRHCREHRLSDVVVYIRPVFGNLANGSWIRATNKRHHGCGPEIKTTQEPNLSHVVAGVGSVVSIVLFFCCLSHCILIQKRKEAMRAVALKVNGLKSKDADSKTSNPLLSDNIEEVTENAHSEEPVGDDVKNHDTSDCTTKIDDKKTEDIDIIVSTPLDDDVKITFTLMPGDDVYDCKDDDMLIPLTQPDNAVNDINCVEEESEDKQKRVHQDLPQEKPNLNLSKENHSDLLKQKPQPDLPLVTPYIDPLKGVSDESLMTVSEDNSLVMNEQFVKDIDDAVIIPQNINDTANTKETTGNTSKNNNNIVNSNCSINQNKNHGNSETIDSNGK